jgi:NADH-quinone oxidoreductase subunit N
MPVLVDPLLLTRALLPELVVMGGAMVLLLVAVWAPERDTRRGLLLLGALGLCAAGMLAVLFTAATMPGAGVGPLATDPFRWTTDAIVLLATALTLMVMRDHAPRARLPFGEPAVLVLLAAGGMMLLAAARDLTLVFLGIELMSVASYVLAGMDRKSPRSAEAALKYFLLGAFSTGFLLYGIALLYGATGSTSLPGIGLALAGASTPSLMAMAGFGLLLVGFAFKVAAVPFHLWTPDVYDGAPTPISGFFAAAVKAGAFTALVRVALEAVPYGLNAWREGLWWLAALTMIAGNIFAIQQRNLKRMLAYSSIAHAGFLLVAVTTQTPAGAAAVQFYLLAYALATIGAFAVLSAVGEAADGILHARRLEGLWQVRPGLAMAMAVFMLALLGFPLAGGIGFFAKWYVLQAAIQAPAPQTALAIILVVATVASATFYLYVVMVMFMRPRPDGAADPLPTPSLTQAVIATAVIVILLFGVYPTPLVSVARSTANASFPVRTIGQ